MSRVIIPLIFWTFFYFCWNNYWYHSPIDLKSVVYAYMTVGLGHLYFLVIMAGLYLITPILGIFSSNAASIYKKYFLILSFAFSFLLYLLNRLIPFGANKDNIFTAFIIYICFYYAGEYFRIKKLNVNQLKLLLVLFIAFGLLNAGFNYLTAVLERAGVSILWATNINQYFYNPMSPFILTMTILLFVIFINLDFNGLLNNSHIKNLVLTLSSSIFGIYLTHPIITQLLDQYAKLGINYLLSPLWFYMLIKIVLVFLLTFLLVIFGKKIPYLKTIFG